MQTLYIKNLKLENKKNILDRLLFWYKKTFNVLNINTIDNMVICEIPYINKPKEEKMTKICKKVCKKFFTDFQLKNYQKPIVNFKSLKKDYFVNKVVLSKDLENNYILKNEINNYNIEILNGRWLFKYLIIKVLEYISKNKNVSLEEQNISILINDTEQLNLNLIILIAQKVKRLSIITNNIKKFKYIEEKLYNNYGIAIEISNNKRKSLLQTDIVINVDFNEEDLNKYKINNRAILINISEKNKIYKKAFNGININYYKILYKNIEAFKENNIFDNFDKTILYESYIHRKDNLINILDQLDRDKVEISGLIGNNGKIDLSEFKLKVLDKCENMS